MPRKRKSAPAVAAEDPHEPQLLQAEQDPEYPEPTAEDRDELQPLQVEQVPQYPEPEGSLQVQEEGEGVVDEESPADVVYEEEEKDEPKAEEGENDVDEDPDNMAKQSIDDVKENTANTDQKIEFSGDPPQTAASENRGDDEGEGEDEPLEKMLEPFSKDQLTLLVKEAVDIHSDLIEIVRKLADSDPSHRKIFIYGLGWEASVEIITISFRKYGEIEECKVVKDKISGKSKGYAFILFKHRKGARRALKDPQKLVEGRMVSCQLASAGPVRAPTAPVAAAAAAPAPYESEYTRRKIFVTNVSPELDMNKLLEFFSTFGEIEEGPLGLDKQTGKPRGFCLFVYKTLESAKKALEEPHKIFEGQTLHCQKAVDGPKPSKGFFSPEQSQPPRHHHGNQGKYRHPAKKGRYSSGSGEGIRPAGGHLMAPNLSQVGYNSAVQPAAIGQAVAALLATQGAGLGIGNLLGGFGNGAAPQGGPQMMNNAGYDGQGGVGYVGQPRMQGGYGNQSQMGQGGVRPYQGGARYMGGPGY